MTATRLFLDSECIRNNITLGVGHDKLCFPEALNRNCDQSETLLVCLKMLEEQFCGFNVILHWNKQR